MRPSERLNPLERLLGDADLGNDHADNGARARVLELWRRLTPEEQDEQLQRVARGEIPSLSRPETIQQAQRVLGWLQGSDRLR